MSESGHSESGRAIGAGTPTPPPPGGKLGPLLAWLGIGVLFVVAVVAVGSWVFQRPIWRSADRPRVDGGSIFVHGPQVYTRERLVNDRYQEDSWLNAMLEKSTTEKFGYAVARGSAATDRRIGGVNLGVNAAPGAPPNAGGANTAPSNPPSPPGAPGAPATDSQGLPDISEQPTFKLQATRAYREQIRTLLIENQLDDRHDLHGNTLYRLRFDATILPNEGSRSAAQIEIFIDPPAFQKPTAPAKPGPPGGKDLQVAAAPNKEALPTVASDNVQAGTASYKEVSEWLGNWRDLYERWRASLELRLEDSAVALARSFEAGRFGPDDYDIMIRRLRYGLQAIATDTDNAPRRIEQLRAASEQAARSAKQEADRTKDPVQKRVVLQQADALRELNELVARCVEEKYKKAADVLRGYRAKEPKGFFPVGDTDLIEIQSGKELKDFREAYLLGWRTQGQPIEQDKAHEIYRDRIGDLLYLRRTLMQLTDTTDCSTPLSAVTLIQAAAPLQPAPTPAAFGAQPSPSLAPGAAPGPAAPAPGTTPSATPTAAPPPPTARPSEAAQPAPPPPAAISAPLSQPGASPSGPTVQPAAPGDPAPMSPSTAANVVPPPPPPPGPVPAGQLGGSVSNVPPSSVQLIDAAQLRRRLLDSEFWPRIYKAVTGVDDSMDQVVDRSDLRILTPPSLQRFADVVWEPQRARRVFQVKEITQALAVASDVTCLPIATYGPSERFIAAGGAPLYVPRAQVGLVKAAAKDMELDWLMDKASSELRDRAKEADALKQQSLLVNPCDFRQIRIDVPVGLFNFAKRLSQANEIYTYSISPTEPDELVANRIRSDVLREFAVSATVNELAKGNTSLGAGLKQQEDLSKFLRMDTTQRSVFGYGERSDKAKIGWRVLPHDPPPAGQPGDQAYLAPRQIPMTALISLPAWWPKVTLTVVRKWIDPQGVATAIPGPEPNYPIDLPTNFETLDASLFANADIGPVLIDWQIPKLEARPCRPFSVTLIGRRLWRSTVVTLAGERASRVLVMPNMNGIIATFEQAPRPGNLGDKALGDKPDDKPYLAQLTVWTSQGHVHLPRLIKFEPSALPPGVDENCKKVDPAAAARLPAVAPPPGVAPPPLAAPTTRPNP